MVFVLDQKKHPLMPCTPKRARLLLKRGRAVVHRVQPFVIRLKDRHVEDVIVQPLALKIDPGSKTSGIALARVQETEEGAIHHAVFLGEVSHRGEQVHEHKVRQRNARRRRRSANLRYRAPRFDNRGIPVGWLAPSLLSRVGNIRTWTTRLSKWAPVGRIEVEQVRFDTQLLQNPEISGTHYQQGTLAGWEARAYLLVKYAYQCAYCRQADTPFEVDHILPRSRGGSNRISNLCLACHPCNQKKGNQTAAEFGHPEVEAQAQRPLKDAAAVNSTRFKLVEALRGFGLPVGTWTGGRTRWNRARFGVEKTHALDALCVGELAGVRPGTLKTLAITATGRGEHCRTNWTKQGFPRGYKLRQKQVCGFKTGDRVRAVVPATLKTAGRHVGRVQVRKSGSFAIKTRERDLDGISAVYIELIQRGDGYDYTVV
jgi:5-methylcytosine-specific restriction endonuclease McrA